LRGAFNNLIKSALELISAEVQMPQQRTSAEFGKGLKFILRKRENKSRTNGSSRIPRDSAPPRMDFPLRFEAAVHWQRAELGIPNKQPVADVPVHALRGSQTNPGQGSIWHRGLFVRGKEHPRNSREGGSSFSRKGKTKAKQKRFFKNSARFGASADGFPSAFRSGRSLAARGIRHTRISNLADVPVHALRGSQTNPGARLDPARGLLFCPQQRTSAEFAEGRTSTF
jgi:hypothetical protein